MTQKHIDKAFQEILVAMEPFVKTRKNNSELLYNAREHLRQYQPFLSALGTDATSHYDRFVELLSEDDGSTAAYGTLVRTTSSNKKKACSELWALFRCALGAARQSTT